MIFESLKVTVGVKRIIALHTYVMNFTVFLILFVLIGCNNIYKKGRAVDSASIYTDRHLEKIELDYVEMYITTFASVKCAEFDNTFFKIKETKVLNNPEDIVAFNRLLDQALTNDQSKQNLDTRIKARLYYRDGKVKQICLGLHGLEMDGDIYPINIEFRNYLLKLTDTD